MTTPHARTEILVGTDGVRRLHGKTVLVAGLGGVGGYCAEAVARAGVGHLILLDHDVIAPSNLNRQLPALHSTLGRAKTAVMAERLRDINPELRITIAERFLHPSQGEAFLAPYALDFLADCIDSIGCKAALVHAAQQRGISVISAMGAGNRLDVRRVHILPLADTVGCPLAREMRRILRGRGGSLDYPVIFSDEVPRKPLPHQPVSGTPGRARAVNGTISYMPALFGIMMAGYIVERLLAE